MRERIFYLVILGIVAGACSKEKSETFVLVEGGSFMNTTSMLYGSDVAVADFYMSKYEVTQKDWKGVMGDNPSAFKGDDLPVEMVSWYDCVEYCNKRSVKEGFETYYNIVKDKMDPNNKSEFDSVKWLVTINEGANGYRLPTEVEWEYAAGGGAKSKSFAYSGSDDIDEVAWYWKNSGDTTLVGTWSWTVIENNRNKTQPVGAKEPNELVLYDMSGNVREWCGDWFTDAEINSGLVRVQRGGGWIGADYRCKTNNRHSFEASGRGPDQGFRVCRSI